MPMARPAAVWLRSWFSRACRTSPPSLTSEVAASRLARSSRRSRPGMEPRVAGRPYRALRVGFVRSDPVAPWLGRARPAPRLPLAGRMAPGCRRSSRRLPSAGKHRHVLPVPGKPQAPRATLGHGRPLTGKPQAPRATLGHGRPLTGKPQAPRATLGHGRPLTGKPQAPRATLGHGRPLTGKPQASPKQAPSLAQPGPAKPRAPLFRPRSRTNGPRLDGRTAQA